MLTEVALKWAEYVSYASFIRVPKTGLRQRAPLMPVSALEPVSDAFSLAVQPSFPLPSMTAFLPCLLP